MKKLLVTCLVFLISGCGDPIKDDFMRGCTGGMSYLKNSCSCAYEKLEDQYGDQIEFELRQLSPNAFMQKVMNLISECRGE